MAAENPALNPVAFQRGVAEAPAAERTGMTVAGSYVKTGLLLVLLIIAAAFGWSQVEVLSLADGRVVAVQPPWTWLVIVLTFVLGIAGAFAFKSARAIAPLYALSEGILLGIASHYFDLYYGGIVLQAIIATVAIFAAMLVLYSARVIKVTQRYVGAVIAAIFALLLLFMTAWLLSLFGANVAFLYQPTPLGIVLSLGIVLLGALNLPVDFAFIETASASGAPKYMEWYAAFGLILSLIWIYVSVLRLLAILRSASR